MTFAYSRFLASAFVSVYVSVSLPSPSTVTRLSGRGRSSVESQKSIAWRAIRSSVHSGASFVSRGRSPRNIGAVDLPTIWTFPSGYSKSSLPK